MSRKVCSAMLCNYILVGLLVAPLIIAKGHDSHVFFNFDRSWSLDELSAVLPTPDIAHAIGQIVERTKSTPQGVEVDALKKDPASPASKTASKSAPPDWMQRHGAKTSDDKLDKCKLENQGLRSNLTKLTQQRSIYGGPLPLPLAAGVVQKESFHEVVSVPSPIGRWRYLFLLAGILAFIGFIAWSGLSSKLRLPPHLSYVLSTLPTNATETGGSFSDAGTFQSSLKLETLADAEYNREVLKSARAKHDILVTSQESSKAQILVLESKLAKSEGEKTSAASASLHAQSNTKINELNAQIAKDKKAALAIQSELESKLKKVEGEKSSAASINVQSKSKIDELNAQIAKDKKSYVAIVSELESKLARIEKEKSSAATLHVKSNTKIDEPTAQIAKDKKAALAIQSDMESSKAQILVLESKLTKIEGEKSSAASINAQSKCKIDELNAQIAIDKKAALAVQSELESKLVMVEGEKTSAASQQVESNTKIDEMNAQIAKDTTSSHDIIAYIASLKDNIIELESELEIIEDEKTSANIEAKAKIDELTAQIASDKKASLDVISDRDQMIVSIASLESYTEKQTGKVASLESDIEKQNGKLESNTKLIAKLEEERNALLKKVQVLEASSKSQVGDAEKKLNMMTIDTNDQISAFNLKQSQLSSERDDIFTSKQLGDKDIIELKQQLLSERKNMKDSQAAWKLIDSENMERNIIAETDIIGLKNKLEIERKNGMAVKKSAVSDIAGLNKQLETEKKNGEDLKQSTDRDVIELNKQLKAEKQKLKDAKTQLDAEKKKGQDAKQLADRGNADLTTQLESEKTKKQGAIAARGAVDLKNKELLTVTSELKSQVDTLSTTKTASDTHIAQLKKQMKTDKAQTDDLNSKIEVERAETKKQSLIMIMENEELKDVVSKGEETAVVLRRQSAILHTENEELRGVVSEGEATNAVLRRNSQTFSRQQSNEEEIKYKTQIDQLSKGKTASDNRVSELEGQARVDKAHTKDLVSELEGQLMEEMATTLSLQTQSIHMNASREPLEIALKASQDRADRSTSQIDDLNAQLKQKDVEMSKLRQKLDAVQAQCDASEKKNQFNLRFPRESAESGASQADLQNKIGDLEAHRDRLRLKAANARFGLRVDANTSEASPRCVLPQKFPENIPQNSLPQNFSDMDEWVPAEKAPITSATYKGAKAGAASAQNGVQSGAQSGQRTPTSPAGGAFDLFFTNTSGGIDDTNLVSDDENGEDSDSENSGVRMGIFTDANHSMSAGSDSESDSDRTLRSNESKISRIDAMEEDGEIFPKRVARTSARRGVRPLLVTLDAVTLSDGEEERFNSGMSKSSTPTAPVSSLTSPHTRPSHSPKQHHTCHLPGQGQTNITRPLSRPDSLNKEEGATLSNAYTVFTSMFKSASAPSSQRAPH